MKFVILKTVQPYFDDVLSGKKSFEVRLDDDHDFETGDILILQEYNPETKKMSARWGMFKATYIMDFSDVAMLYEDVIKNNVYGKYVIIGIQKMMDYTQSVYKPNSDIATKGAKQAVMECPIGKRDWMEVEEDLKV